MSSAKISYWTKLSRKSQGNFEVLCDVKAILAERSYHFLRSVHWFRGLNYCYHYFLSVHWFNGLKLALWLGCLRRPGTGAICRKQSGHTDTLKLKMSQMDSEQNLNELWGSISWRITFIIRGNCEESSWAIEETVSWGTATRESGCDGALAFASALPEEPSYSQSCCYTGAPTPSLIQQTPSLRLYRLRADSPLKVGIIPTSLSTLAKFLESKFRTLSDELNVDNQGKWYLSKDYQKHLI